MKLPYTSKMFLINVAHFDVSKTYWRHLTAGLLYNDFAYRVSKTFKILVDYGILVFIP
jgi:hypothetical protein